MQIRKRNASLLRRSIACSFSFSQAPGRRLRKERDSSQSGLSLSARNTIPCLGQVFNPFMTEAIQIVYPVEDSEAKNHTLSSGTSRIAQIRESPPPGGFSQPDPYLQPPFPRSSSVPTPHIYHLQSIILN